jgi:sporulation protein YabP
MDNNSGILQNLFLENREKLTLSGVSDVLSFDDQIIILETEMGMLTIKGEKLRINKLSIDTSDISIEGIINSFSYTGKDLEKKNGTFVSKLFK